MLLKGGLNIFLNIFREIYLERYTLRAGQLRKRLRCEENKGTQGKQ